MREGIPNHPHPSKETPLRFRLGVEAMVKANFADVEMRGEEHLAELPPDAKVIFATTHISDFDVVIPVAKLGKRFRMKVVNASLQHEFSEDPVSRVGLAFMGEKNALPVDMKWGVHPETNKREYYTRRFNSENFEPMRESLEDGDAIVIAAYTPAAVKDGVLPKSGGYGAVYLAEISGAYIVPVAINILSEDSEMGVRRTISKSVQSRPKVEMIIGEPMKLAPIPNVEHFGEYLKRTTDTEAQGDTKEERRQVTDGLREQSDALMTSLAQLLPENRRGPWGANPATTEQHER